MSMPMPEGIGETPAIALQVAGLGPESEGNIGSPARWPGGSWY